MKITDGMCVAKALLFFEKIDSFFDSCMAKGEGVSSP